MNSSTSAGKLARLADFRQLFYNRILLRAADAQFELLDAVLTTRAITCFAELSLAPVFRRGWPSLYEALDDGEIDTGALLPMLVTQMQQERSADDSRGVLVLDHSSYPRVQSYTLAERGFHHAATGVPGNRPITIGYSYSTVGWIAHAERQNDAPPARRDSWCLPLLQERILPASTPIATGAEQLKRVLAAMADAPRPLLLADSEYASASFLTATAELPCDMLMRLRPNRVLYAAPPEYSGRGRRPIHGAKFVLKDPTTWPDASEQDLVATSDGRSIRLRRWSGLHMREAATTVVDLILVERCDAEGKVSASMWLIYLGEPTLQLAQMSQLYLRRFGVEHWYRFAKQRLHWTMPRVSTPERIDRWTTLTLLGQWQLYLAREVVIDTPLPWQKRLASPTPGRVAEGFAGVIARIGTPAVAPKPRGKSPGWPNGRARKPRAQHPVEHKPPRTRASAAKPPP